MARFDPPYAVNSALTDIPNTWSGEQAFLDYITVANKASLPTPSSTYRGKIARIEGTTGVRDVFYVCEKANNNNYYWRMLSSYSVNVLDFGAKGDAKTVTDASITAVTATLTSATAGFTANDVGKQIIVVGAGTSGKNLWTTIATYVSATQVTLASAAGTTVSGASMTFGTDDTTALSAALSVAGTAVSNTKSQIDVFGTSHVCITTLTVPANVRLRDTKMTFTGTPNSTTAAICLNDLGASVERCTINVLAGDYRRTVAHRASNTATRFCTIAHTTPDVPTPTNYQSGQNVYVIFSAMGTTMTGIVIEGNDITCTAWLADGVQMSLCPSARIVRNRFHDFTLNFSVDEDKRHMWGIYAAASCQGVLIEGNIIENMGGSGIHCNASTGGSATDYGRKIIGNTVRNCSFHGIAFDDVNGGVIANNHISQCNWLMNVGSSLNPAVNCIIEGNSFEETIYDSSPTDATFRCMLHCYGTAPIIRGNSFGKRGEAYTCIVLDHADGAVVEGNTFGPNRPRTVLNMDNGGTSGFGVFRGNTIKDTDDTTTAIGCLYFYNSDWVVQGNTIIHNVAGGSSWFALRLGGDNILVTGNRIKAGSAIFCPSGGDNHLITDNDFTGCGAAPNDSGIGSLWSNNRGISKDQIINVKAYGAKGDGTTDDTAAIQAAIDAAELVRGTVFFPTGEYKITAALVCDVQGVSLIGVSSNGTLGSATIGSAIKQITTTVDCLKIKADGITVQDLQLNGPSSGTGRGLVIDTEVSGPPTQYQVTVRRVRARNFGGDGVVALKSEQLTLDTVLSTANGGKGIYIDLSGSSVPTNPLLINCRASSNTGTHQIHIKDAIGPVLINCQALTGTAGNANLRLQNCSAPSVINGDYESGGDFGIQVSGSGGSIRDADFISVTTGINVTSWTDGMIEGCRFTSTVTNSIATDSATRISVSSLADSSVSGINPNAVSEVTLLWRRQVVAYAASITPNPTKGEYVEVGALTGGITINAPTRPAKGLLLTFRFLQDATGGRAVTWNAAFKHAWSDTGNTANKQSTIRFVYDGTNWIQMGAQSPYV